MQGKNENGILIYALVDSKNRVFINFTSGRGERCYRECAKSYLTKHFFMGDENKMPVMYKLERNLITKEQAYSRSIAWTKFFIDSGMSVVEHKNMVACTADMHADTQEYYNEISLKFLAQVLTAENKIKDSYNRRGKKPKSIRFDVTDEEYAKILEQAGHYIMPVEEYCHNVAVEKSRETPQMVMNKEIEMLHEIRDLLTYYTLTGYREEDWGAILEAMEEIKKVCKLLTNRYCG